MRTDNQKNETKKKPQQQTGEEFGKIKSGQLNERTAGKRWDIPRGSETETRGPASRRG